MRVTLLRNEDKTARWFPLSGYIPDSDFSVRGHIPDSVDRHFPQHNCISGIGASSFPADGRKEQQYPRQVRQRVGTRKKSCDRDNGRAMYSPRNNTFSLPYGGVMELKPPRMPLRRILVLFGRKSGRGDNSDACRNDCNQSASELMEAG